MAHFELVERTSESGLAFLQGTAVGLMRLAELPIDRVTVMHRDLFKRAGIEWRDGESMDARMSTLTADQLDGVIEQLRDDDTEEDDDE